MADGRLIGHAIRDEHTLALNELEELYIDKFDLRKLLIYYIDGVDASALPALAYQFNVLDPEWNLVTTEQQKRDLIKNALDLHRYRGTPWAIRNVFEMLGIFAELSEWFEFGELPGRYMIKLKTPVPKQTSDLLFALIKKYKRKSSKQITHYINDPSLWKLAGGIRFDRVIKFSVQIVTPPLPTSSYLLDSDGNILTDADGNKLVYNPVETESFYLLDSDGNILTDADENKLIYNPVEVSSFLLDPDGNILTDADGNKLIYNPVEASSYLLDPDGNILIDNLGNTLFY